MDNIELIQFVNYDKQAKIEFKVLREEKLDKNIIIRDISFEGKIQNKIRAYLVSPQGKGPFPAVQFVHWLETNAENSNRTEFLPMAIELANQGFVSILPECFWSVDKENYKDNPEFYHSRWWKTNYDNDSLLCKNQIIDLINSYKILTSLENVDGNQITLAAHDFGAMFGLLLPALGYQYNKHVVMAATGRFSDWFRFGSKKTEEELQPYISQMNFLDPITNLEFVNPNKILFQFADDDFYVPEKNAKNLYNKAGIHNEIRWYSAKHAMNDRAFLDMKKWIIANI